MSVGKVITIVKRRLTFRWRTLATPCSCIIGIRVNPVLRHGSNNLGPQSMKCLIRQSWHDDRYLGSRVSYCSVLTVVKVRTKATATTAVWVKCFLVIDASDDLARFAVTRRSACSEIAHVSHCIEQGFI